jgi:hypothetical protein
MKKKVIIFYLAIGISILAIIFAAWLFRDQELLSRGVFPLVKDVGVTGRDITVNGVFLVSDSSMGVAYTRYSADYRDETLFIKIRGRDALIPNEKAGFFDITIPNRYGNIKAIYLWGGSEDESLMIWPVNETDKQPQPPPQELEVAP